MNKETIVVLVGLIVVVLAVLLAAEAVFKGTSVRELFQWGNMPAGESIVMESYYKTFTRLSLCV